MKPLEIVIENGQGQIHKEIKLEVLLITRKQCNKGDCEWNYEMFCPDSEWKVGCQIAQECDDIVKVKPK